MAGLIFLWQNIPSIPPVVVDIDYGIKPIMASITSDFAVLESIYSPLAMVSISDITPVLSVQNTINTFTETDNTWSDADTAWSDSSAVWGGFDPKSADKPIFDRIDSVRPQFIKAS